MVIARSLVQGLALCGLYLLFKLSSLKDSMENTSVKEGYLNTFPQETEISSTFHLNTEEFELEWVFTSRCTYNVILSYDGDPSLVKKEDFDVDICKLHQIVLLSRNKDIASERYITANATENKIVYVYSEVDDVTHLQLAMSMYYDIMYSLVITDLTKLTNNTHMWVYAALKGLLSIQKAAFVFTDADLTSASPSPDQLPVIATFTRTKTIRRLLTSTNIVSDGSNALVSLLSFLHCQEQRIMYITIHSEDVKYANVNTSLWHCDNNLYAIHSGCVGSYTNNNVASIIQVFRRPYLKEQLLQMDMGSFNLTRIIVYQSLGYVDYRGLLENCTICRHFWSLNYDFKLLFRFLFAFAIPEHFTFYYSDDIIPSRELNERIAHCAIETHAICGYAGRIIHELSLNPQNYSQFRTTRPGLVDWAVGLYATEAQGSRTVFRVRALTYDYAEDMHLSFASALACKAKTRIIESREDMYKSHSNDEYAAYKSEVSHMLRYRTMRYFVENRFVPIRRLGHVLGEERSKWTLTKNELYYFTK